MTVVLRRIGNSALSLYVSVSVLYLLAFTWPFTLGNPVRDEVQCGWDGTWYCLMFQGLNNEVAEPFRRRIAPPFLARLFDADPIDAFLTLNVLAMLVVAMTTTTMLVLSHPKSSGLAYRWVTTIGVASVIAFSRNTFHHFINAPVLTDYVALAGIFLFVLGVFVSVRDNLLPLGLVTVAIAVPLAALSREALGPALIASGVAMLFRGNLRWVGALSILAATATTAFTLVTSSAGDSVGVISGWIVAYTSGWQSLTVFGVMLAVSLGVWPIILSLAGRTSLRQEWTPSVVVLALALFAISVFGGGNLDRILLPVGLLLAFVVAVEARNPLQLGAFAAAAYGMVVMQYPFFIMEDGAENFLAFIDFWHSATFEQVLSFGVGGILMASPLLTGAVTFALLARKRKDLTFQVSWTSDRNSS